MDRRRGIRPYHAIFAVALLGTVLRAGFVAWAPGILDGDGLFYHLASVLLSRGEGYLEPDGSPGIQWMPGWPVTLAAIYKLFGQEPRAAMYVSALLGGATSGLIVVLGRRLFSPAVGLVAGLVYACWPGNVYYAATLLTESLFNFVLVACLTALAVGATAEGARRTAWFGAARPRRNAHRVSVCR
jgi:4-amino-4-deoxy-L-arabinose transferase-like glycosyltransferase